MPSPPDHIPLADLLHRTFGFPAFRANQEAVCRAATAGQDVLLVMPTGAGKSLCYQLPAIARGGTALVISPLIALMDDQAAKLTAAGLSVARIHSGLSRDQAREACRAYLDGSLQFLFIAPERMRVPGFPEMLARRKPSLIAIDEAHCISAWGHDFRPDYRTLGEHLPLLRPSPIIALTATATPTVQRDIVAQLQLASPALFIHGFRRDNLHIEVVEMSKPRRNEFVVNLLKQPANRPAIVYAPSKKATEELASLLGGKAASYHAGLENSVRERVQKHFQSGQLEVVVATIAFGMGIDKADVRTVVHIALPASVEAYYQEIGRAGRDGNPSRTVLLHSYQDRKMHDFFLDRDYPPAPNLAKVATLLTDDFQMPEILAQRLKMSRDDFAKAAEKLASQGAAAIDMDGHVRATGQTRWQAGYEQQIAFRRSQIDRMVAFAEATQCRMTALIQHFGDTADGLKPCGHCDFCAPEHSTASPFREPTAKEDRHLRAILGALKGGVSRSTGKLHTELGLTPDRKLFDTYLDALSRAGLLTLHTDTFTNPEGAVISYKKASLTYEGNQITPTAPLQALLRDSAPIDAEPRSYSGRGSRADGTNPRALGTNPRALRAGRREKRAADRTPQEQEAHRNTEKKRVAKRTEATDAYSQQQQSLDKQLREWRKTEAARNGRPAFYVLTDAVLIDVVYAQPKSMSQLLEVRGIGQDRVDKYGAAIIAICREAEPPVIPPPSALTPQNPPSRPSHSAVESPDSSDLVHSRLEGKRKHQSAVQQIRQNFKLAAEDLKPLSMKTSAGRKRAKAYDDSANQRLNFEDDLRAFAVEQSKKLNKPPSQLLSEAAIADILRFRPRTLTELERLQHIRGDLPQAFHYALLATCVDEYKPQREPLKQPHRVPNAVDAVFVREPSMHRVRETPVPNPAAVLTPAQQSLDTRLRDWRKVEADKMGMPQFFVLSSTSLRDIVVERPRTLPELGKIFGIAQDKLDKFGPAILALCNNHT